MSKNGQLTIGLTGDSMLKKKEGYDFIQNYELRKFYLTKFLKEFNKNLELNVKFKIKNFIKEII